MRSFSISKRSPAAQFIQAISKELEFLDGRAEKYEGFSVRVASRINSVTVHIGDTEQHSLTFHHTDNSWTVRYVPRECWVEGGIMSADIAREAARTFIDSVAHSLGACRQIGGAPMFAPNEIARVLNSIC